MIGQLNRLDVQMLIDPSAVFDDVNYTIGTLNSTGLTLADWMLSSCPQHQCGDSDQMTG